MGAPTEVSSLMVWEKELYPGHSSTADISLARGHKREETRPQARRVLSKSVPGPVSCAGGGIWCGLMQDRHR